MQVIAWLTPPEIKQKFWFFLQKKGRKMCSTTWMKNERYLRLQRIFFPDRRYCSASYCFFVGAHLLSIAESKNYFCYSSSLKSAQKVQKSDTACLWNSSDNHNNNNKSVNRSCNKCFNGTHIRWIFLEFLTRRRLTCTKNVVKSFLISINKVKE